MVARSLTFDPSSWFAAGPLSAAYWAIASDSKRWKEEVASLNAGTRPSGKSERNSGVRLVWKKTNSGNRSMVLWLKAAAAWIWKVVC